MSIESECAPRRRKVIAVVASAVVTLAMTAGCDTKSSRLAGPEDPETTLPVPPGIPPLPLPSDIPPVPLPSAVPTVQLPNDIPDVQLPSNVPRVELPADIPPVPLPADIPAIHFPIFRGSSGRPCAAGMNSRT
jgi:hypothetical protein